MLSGFSDLPTSTELVLGIRPDALAQADDGQFNMRVDIVEQHGSDNLIYGVVQDAATSDNDGTDFCFKTSHNLLPDLESTLKLGYDANKAMIFDRATE